VVNFLLAEFIEACRSLIFLSRASGSERETGNWKLEKRETEIRMLRAKSVGNSNPNENKRVLVINY
jgi:hypothetical protein